MDAVLTGRYCRRPLHYMIRSDMFNNALFRWLLKRLNGIPVYRLSEEKEKLKQNYSSFELCREILKQKGIILIFPEGATELDWRLKPMKSGISKLVWYCLEDPILREELKILPVGFTYNCYDRFAKTIFIKSSEPFFPGKMEMNESHGDWKNRFNGMLYDKMRMLAPNMTHPAKNRERLWKIVLTNFYQVNKISSLLTDQLQEIGTAIELLTIGDREFKESKRNYQFILPGKSMFWPVIISIFLLGPAIAGCILNGIFYFPVRNAVRRKTKGTIFFDSLLFSLLTGLYPVYVLLLSAGLGSIISIPFWYWIPAIPFSGWFLIVWFKNVSALSNRSASGKNEITLLKEVMSYAQGNKPH